MKRVFIGTMFCGEGDFNKCLLSIANQKEVKLHQHIVKGLPEFEAHNALWEAWNNVKHEYDYFVKVDADTVLAHDFVLHDFGKLLETDEQITGIQAPLLDYFTMTYINGLNCFTPNVIFKPATSKLFCDRADTGHNKMVSSSDVPHSLRPAGYHCYHASNKQAFHFGIHRALKNQTRVLDAVRDQVKKEPDNRTRTFVLLGAAAAPAFLDGEFDYDSERFKLAFEATEKKYDELVKQL